METNAKQINKSNTYPIHNIRHFHQRRSFGVLIQIDEKYKEDKDLLAHERVHVKQFLRLWLSAITIGLVLLCLGYDRLDII